MSSENKRVIGVSWACNTSISTANNICRGQKIFRDGRVLTLTLFLVSVEAHTCAVVMTAPLAGSTTLAGVMILPFTMAMYCLASAGVMVRPSMTLNLIVARNNGFVKKKSRKKYLRLIRWRTRPTNGCLSYQLRQSKKA